MGSNEPSFEPLPIRKRMVLGADANQYCVWDISGKSSEIRAETAYEAFRKSGMKDAIKIERLFKNGDVVEQSKLTIAQKGAKEIGTENSLHETIFSRKTPIISADELDALLRAAPKPVAALAEAAAMVPVAPEPAGSVTQAISPGAAGMDVEGDGFNEIIPAAPAMKLPTVKPQNTQTAPPQAEAAAEPKLPPERELSPEEIEKLLGDKNSQA